MVQLFQGCKSETELINTNPSCSTIPSIVAVVQHVCQVTLSTSLHTHQPFVYDNKHCWWRITKPIPSIVAVMQHVCQVTLSTSPHTHQLFVFNTKYCWRSVTKRFELNTECKSFKIFN
jgi:hypothetical protein